MAEKKEKVTVTDEAAKAIRNLNVYGKLAVARGRFLNAPLKKSGINRYADFKYFELEDIVPVAIDIFTELGLVLLENITYEESKATLVNVDNPSEVIEFNTPAKDPNIEDGTKMSAIQGLGAYVTYQRRYLYMLVLDIVEADPVDSTIGKTDEEVSKPTKKSNKPATAEERQDVKEALINQDGNATDTQIKAIKNGLKKLREKDEKYEPYIKETIKKIKAGMTKTEAEDRLIEIGNKVAE